MPDITYARVVDGTVHGDPITLPDDVKLGEDLFPLDEAALWRPCGAGVRDGWTFDGKAFAAPIEATQPAPVRTATTYQLMSAFTDAQRTAYGTAVKAWDQRLFSARDTPWPESNEKIGRIAAAIGTTSVAWFDTALAPAT